MRSVPYFALAALMLAAGFALLTITGSLMSRPAGPMAITVERPRALRCGTPSVDNVCVGDLVIVQAPRARAIAIYRTDIARGRNRLELACPGDPRCSGVRAAVYRAVPGEVYILAIDARVPLGETVDEAMLTARRQGATVEYQRIEVRL